MCGAALWMAIALMGIAGVATADTASADADWMRLESIFSPGIAGADDNPVEELRQAELRARQYREQGLSFYRHHPADKRRWEWLLRTRVCEPAYWSDPMQGAAAEVTPRPGPVAIDEPERARWEELMRSELRPAFLSSTQVTSEQRMDWYRISMNRSQREINLGRKVGWRDVSELTYLLLAYAAEQTPAPDAELIATEVGMLKFFMDETRMGFHEQQIVVSALASSGNAELRSLVAGMQRVLDITDHPLELKLAALDGSMLDVADWRGKVLLVDLWSTTCGSCIEALPRIKAIYDRYHARGFEVLSVCMDLAGNRGKFDAIRRRIDMPWPTTWVTLTPPWRKAPLPARFGVTGMPQYLLLDRSGRLVGTDYYGSEGAQALEGQVRALLTEAVDPDLTRNE